MAPRAPFQPSLKGAVFAGASVGLLLLIGIAALGGVDGITVALTSVPEVSIDSPDAGSTQTEALIKVKGHAGVRTGDSPWHPPASVQLKVNDDVVAVENTNQAGEFKFGNVSLRKGANVIRVDATEKVVWRRFDAWTQVAVTVMPVEPTVPKIDAIPGTTNSSSLIVQGSADPAVRVQVKRTLKPPDGGADDVTEFAQQTDSITGRFAVEVPLYVSGSYEFSAYAVDNRGAQSRTSAPVRVTFDPSAQSMPKQRKLRLTQTATSLHVELEMILAAEDQKGRKWLHGDLSLAELVAQVFGALDVNDRSLSDMFVGVDGMRQMSGGGLDIKASSNPELEAARLSDALVVHVKEGTFLSGPNDSLTFLVRDYKITAVEPPPSEFSSSGPSWQGPIGLSDPSLKASLDIRGAGPVAMAHLRPYDVVPWPASTLVSFLYALMNGVALVWYLLLARIYQETGWLKTGNAKRLRRLALWLLGVCFVPPLMDLGQAVSDSLTHASIAIAGLITLIGLWLVFRKRDTTKVGYLALVVLRSALIGSALSALILLVTLVWWSVPLFVDYRFVAWAVNGTVLTVSVVLASGIALQEFAATSWPMRDRRRRRVLLAVLGVLAVAASIPVATSVYRVAGIGSPDALSQAVRAGFQLFQYYSAYVVLIGVAALLRRSALGDSSVPRRLAFNLAWLLFANFMIVIDPYLFVPLSFALGLILFRLLLVIPNPKRDDLLDDASEVRARRLRLLQLLDDEKSLLKDLQSASDAAKKSLEAGTITLGTFNRRKAKIEADRKAHHESVSMSGPSGKGRSGRQVVLAYGPRDNDWANGLYGARIALIVAVPWLLLYFTVFLFQAGEISTPIKPLLISGIAIAEPFNWALIGFFFGYFFTYIRGTTGLRKGLWITLVYSICQAPYWLTTPRNDPEAWSTALVVCTSVLSFTVIGLWFDFKTIREGLADRVSWNTFGRLTGLGSLTAFVSVVATTLGVTLTSVLSGEFVSIAGLVLHAVGAPVPGMGGPVPGAGGPGTGGH